MDWKTAIAFAAPIIASIISYLLYQHYSKPRLLYFLNNVSLFKINAVTTTQPPVGTEPPRDKQSPNTDTINPTTTEAPPTNNPNLDQAVQKQNSIFVTTFKLINAGRSSAQSVRLIHHPVQTIEPILVSIFPTIPFSINNNLQHQAHEIFIESIPPKYDLSISYLHTHSVKLEEILSHITFKDGFATRIETVPAIILKYWQKWLLRILIFIGLSFSIYYFTLFLTHLLICLHFNQS